MLYSKERLESLKTLTDFENMSIVVRYMSKIKKGEINKIRFYEWDFICHLLNHTVEEKENGEQYLIGSYEIGKCKHCNFKSLTLAYFNNLDFFYPVIINQVIEGKSITIKWDKERVLQDKIKFNGLLNWWQNELLHSIKVDRFTHEARTEYKLKINLLNQIRREQFINKFRFERLVLEWQLLIFYICYLGRVHFSSESKNYKIFKVE